MSEKLLFTGKTHTTSGRDGYAKSSDGHLDIKLPEPHPAAEQLFGAAWSACYMGAIGVAAIDGVTKHLREHHSEAGEGGNDVQ